MPINCLIKFLINSEQSCSKINSWSIREQFMNIHVSKKRPFRLSSFALRLFLSFPLSSSLFLSLPLSSSLFLSLPLLLSFFNVHSSCPANSLKTKDLRKRHFWLKFLSHGKPLRLKTLGVKFAQWFVHFPADHTLHTPPKLPVHTPPRNPAPCKVLCRICRPNPTHSTPLTIKS